MEFHGKHSVCVLLMGMLFCTAGCAATEQNPSANHTKATDLPPLVTDTSEETTDAEPEETVSVTETTPAEALYKAKAAAWKMPEELGTLQTVRIYEDDVYLLGTRQERLAADRKRVVSCKGGYGTGICTAVRQCNASLLSG